MIKSGVASGDIIDLLRLHDFVCENVIQQFFYICEKSGLVCQSAKKILHDNINSW